MDQRENNRQIKRFKIQVISRTNYIQNEINILMEKHREKFAQHAIEINNDVSISKKLFSNLNLNNIIFIDASIIEKSKNKVLNDNGYNFDIVLIKNGEISHTSLLSIFRFFENNSLNLLGSIDTDNLSQNMVRYLILDFMLKKINE